MQLLLSLIQRCVVILIQNKIWCSFFECFCSTELFSWLFYNQHSHRPVVCLYHSVMEWSLPCNWNNKCLIKNNILTVIKLAPVTYSPNSLSSGLFTLPDSDSDTDSDLDFKPNSYMHRLGFYSLFLHSIGTRVRVRTCIWVQQCNSAIKTRWPLLIFTNFTNQRFYCNWKANHKSRKIS